MDSPTMDSPTWNPRTEDDLLTAAKGGLLEETHHLEIKKQLPSGKGANTELARDLASFAVDGGLLLLGVDEDQDPPALQGVPLAGLAERVEQVALTRIDEPLPVRTTLIEASAGKGLGYLAIRIPPSPASPHMVEGRYYGRNDKTKYVLSDDEVFRLHQRRKLWESSAGITLQEYIDQAPFRGGSQAHLFIVADPVSSSDGLLVPIIEKDGAWQQNLLNVILGRVPGAALPGGGFAPNLTHATATARRADGWALTTHHFTEGRQLREGGDETSLLELEISERGRIRLFCGRGTDTVEDGSRVVFEQLIVGLTHELLAVARVLAKEAGYFGSWGLGVALTNAHGAYSYSFRGAFSATGASTFPDNEYRQSTRATLEELKARPNAIVERLVGRLIRALGVRGTQDMRALLD